ncbi:MAG: Nif3-like dinuclear metal center hexameric protein [Spirochaetes bacterium]|nr:Nif3-like dinuclear metal center hexameric protein [Spirochaetota bacterium]
MQLNDLDRFLRSKLAIDAMRGEDPSINGIQVQRREPEISRVAVAVDACLESFRRAAEWGAELLFVHHGLFWGHESPLTGAHYERIRYLMERDLGLYAAHLPLDMHPSLGNNARMASEIGLQQVRPFGSYHGTTIGVTGMLPEPADVGSVCDSLFGGRQEALSVLPFGPEKIESVALVSGGAPRLVSEAIAKEVDLYVTGDASHTIYHEALESETNVVFGGHYNTEVWGVRAVGELLAAELGLETTFVDVPTGL